MQSRWKFSWNQLFILVSSLANTLIWRKNDNFSVKMVRVKFRYFYTVPSFFPISILIWIILANYTPSKMIQDTTVKSAQDVSFIIKNGNIIGTLVILSMNWIFHYLGKWPKLIDWPESKKRQRRTLYSVGNWRCIWLVGLASHNERQKCGKFYGL